MNMESVDTVRNKRILLLGIIMILMNIIMAAVTFFSLGGQVELSLFIDETVYIITGLIIVFGCKGNSIRASGYAGLALGLVTVLGNRAYIINPGEDMSIIGLFFTIAALAAIVLIYCSIVCILELTYTAVRVLVLTSICALMMLLYLIWAIHTVSDISVIAGITLSLLPTFVMYAVFIYVMTRKDVLPPNQFRWTKMNSQWMSTTSRIDSDASMLREDLKNVLDPERKEWMESNDPIECEMAVPLYGTKNFSELLFVKYNFDDKIHMMVRVKNARSFINVFEMRIESYRMEGTIDDCTKIRFYGGVGMYADVKITGYYERKVGYIETYKMRKSLKKQSGTL